MPIAGIIVICCFCAGLIILFTFLIKRRMKDVKIGDANIPGQINDIVKKVVSDSLGYKVVPGISEQSTGSMIKDTVKENLIKGVTGFRVHIYSPNETFILIYGNMEIYFVPISSDIHSKQLQADYTKITKLTTKDLLKVKANGSGSLTTFVDINKEKFLIRTMSTFFFDGISAKTEKEEFAEFIRNFQMTVSI